MKTGLLFGVVMIGAAAGGMVGGVAEVWAACIPTNDCAELGFKYSATDCSGEGLACSFDTTRYNCANPCSYTIPAETCTSQCKNVGAKSCKRGNTTYYESCGTSTCSSGQTCENGACKNPTPSVPKEGKCCDDTHSYCVDSLDYKYCKRYWNGPDCSDIMASCRAQGSTPRFQYCLRGDPGGGAPTYYGYAIFSCEMSNSTPKEGNCCGSGYCGYNGTSHSADSRCQSKYGKSCYNECMAVLGVTCDDMQASCIASGGSPTAANCHGPIGDATRLYVSLVCR